MDDFIQGATGGLPAVRFSAVGDTVKGQILNVTKLEDREPDGTIKRWDSGEPKHVWVFDLDTDGTGIADQALWVRGNLVKVLREALATAGLKPSDQPTIEVKHHALGEVKTRGYNAPKLYKARAEPTATKPKVLSSDF